MKYFISGKSKHVPPKALALSAATVEGLFPFHLLLDSSGKRILSVGLGLRELLPANLSETNFIEQFKIQRPRLDSLSVASVKSHLRSTVFLKSVDRELVLRGQVLIAGEDSVLFIGSPLVESGDALEKHDINLNLFQPFDLTPDFVILQKFRELELRDRQRNSRALLQVSQSRDELNEFAHNDMLTKVTNRRGFWKQGEALIVNHRSRSGTKLLLALLDLDNFKTINDDYGHETGDVVLCEVASRLSGFVGEKGLVGRIGGDEFVAILVVCEDEDVHDKAHLLLDKVNLPFKREHHQLPLRASIGIKEISDEDSLDSAIYDADIAMYEGRYKGAEGIFIYTSEFSKKIQEKADMSERLKLAIKSELIEPHFQPVIELSTSRLHGFEALARWRDEKEGMVRPDIFIALADELGMLAELDRQILGKSLDQLVLWHEAGEDYSIHVNISAASINESLFDSVLEALRVRNIDPIYLILELTETIILENTKLTRDIIVGLQERGVKVQLDDFGTGYSSLSHIRDFPVAGIKVDRSFVVDAHINDKSRTLLQSVVNIGLDLKLDMVAEGIENQQQLDFLRSIGCRFGQGFYIGKPATADVCEQLFPEAKQRAA